MKADVGLLSADSGRELLLPTRSPSVRVGNGYSVRAVHCTLALVQLGYAGYQILTRVALVNGIDPFAFSIYRNILAFLLLGPVAFCVERYYNCFYFPFLLLPPSSQDYFQYNVSVSAFLALFGIRHLLGLISSLWWCTLDNLICAVLD